LNFNKTCEFDARRETQYFSVKREAYRRSTIYI